MYYEMILVGVLVSLLYTEFTGLSAGLIIPGYLVMTLHSPARVVSTLILSLMAMVLCQGISRLVIVYGRRRLALLILITFVLASLGGYTGLIPGGASVIGVLVPGIIAREFDRQGVVDTMLSLTVTTGAVAALFLMMGYPVVGV